MTSSPTVSGRPHSAPVGREANFASARAAWSPSLSPDGSFVAYVSDADGVPRVWLHERLTGQARPLPSGPTWVQRVRWSVDGDWLALSVEPFGSPRWRVYVVRPDGTELRELQHPGEGAIQLGPWTHQPGVLAVARTTRSPNGVAELEHAEGGTHGLVATGGHPFVLDLDADNRLALIRRGPRGARTVWLVNRSTGEEGQLLPRGGPGSTDLGRLSPDRRVAYLRSNAGREMYALVAVSLESGNAAVPIVLAERVDAELEDLVLTADGHTLLLLWNVAGRSECELMDVATGIRSALELPHLVAHDANFSRDGRWLALTLEGPEHPKAVWLFDTELRIWAQITRQTEDWIAPSVHPTLERLRSDDGLEITGWLYRPPSSPDASHGPGPTVVHLHGGPEAQERPTFAPLFQELVSEGIAVFAPNVRGSSGFGDAFVNADNIEKRWAAIADVAACVRYLVDRRIAAPDRIACAGRSYGGYLTLALLVFHPELFAAGVDICGISDFHTFYANTESWIGVAAYPKYGHPIHHAALLRALSPIHHFDALRAPLLVVHGGNDTNVPVEEAEQVVAAARARNIPVDYLFFPDEGHELARVTNKVRFVRKTVKWLAARLAPTEHHGVAGVDVPLSALSEPMHILVESDPPPFRVTEGHPHSPYVITADHAGRIIPRVLGSLGLTPTDLERHIAWDIGIAGLSERLAKRLGAFLILQTYSRLVIDCNRPLDSPSSIPVRSENTVIPGNDSMTPQQAEVRAREIFVPYHDRIEAELDRRDALGRPTVFIAMHSFTPRFLEFERPWHCGVLYHRDARLAHRVLAGLRSESGLEVGDNQPYFVSDESDYGIPRYGEQRGYLHVELEIRQDLIAAEREQELWADRLARVIREAFSTFSPSKS